jgi:thiol-disulfide isomerase/thioredoxin
MIFRLMSAALATLCVLTSSLAFAAAPAPHVGVASLDRLPQPLPLPYDEYADADRQVAQAKIRARAEGKRLLIDLGGNWCGDCRVLAGVMALPEVATFLRRHYVVVAVDIGRLDKNAQIAGHYGVARVTGVPALLVINPKTDRLLNPGRISALADARHMTPQALADWLAQWL